MLRQRYSYSDAVRQSGVCIVRLPHYTVSQIHYSMYKMYEHAQSVEYSIIIRRVEVLMVSLIPIEAIWT